MKSQFKKVFSLYMYKEVELITDNRFSGNLYIKIKKPISDVFKKLNTNLEKNTKLCLLTEDFNQELIIEKRRSYLESFQFHKPAYFEDINISNYVLKNNEHLLINKADNQNFSKKSFNDINESNVKKTFFICHKFDLNNLFVKRAFSLENFCGLSEKSIKIKIDLLKSDKETIDMHN